MTARFAASVSDLPSISNSIALLLVKRRVRPTTRNHVGLVPEPKPPVPLQHILRCVQVGAGLDDLGKTLVVDLRHVDGRVPSREKRRCTDACANLGRQGVHAVAEERTLIGVIVKDVFLARRPKVGFGRFHQRFSIRDEWHIARPNVRDNFHSGIFAMGINTNQPAARRKAANKRRDYLASLESRWCQSAIGLGGNYKIVVGAWLFALRS